MGRTFTLQTKRPLGIWAMNSRFSCLFVHHMLHVYIAFQIHFYTYICIYFVCRGEVSDAVENVDMSLEELQQLLMRNHQQSSVESGAGAAVDVGPHIYLQHIHLQHIHLQL